MAEATTSSTHRRPADLVAALASVGLLAAGLGPQFAAWAGNLYDDAYIYLRYAENLLNGCGLTWNCGSIPVEGFTSPLYLGLLTTVGATGVDLEVAATAIGLMTWGVALCGFVLLPFWVRREVPEFPAPLVAVLMSLALATDQLIAINAASGMEGGVVALALLALAMLAWRPATLALVGPATVLVRPELGLATLLQPILGRAHLRRAAVAAVVVFGAVTVLRLVLFRDVLPNTFWAKSGGTPDHLRTGLDYLWTCYSRFPIAALAVLGFASRMRPMRYFAALLLGWSLYFLWSGGDFYSHARLFAFLAPLAYLVAIGTGIELLRRLMSARAWAPAVVGLAVVLGLTWFGRGWRDTYDPRGGFGNVERWAATGQWLHRCIPGASIAAVPIGALAYFSKAPVHDLVGLTDPKLAIDGKRATGDDFIVGHERYDGAWSLGLQPQVVFLEVHATAPIDPRQRINVQFIAERDLLDHLFAQRAPYVALSPEVSPGVYQFLFARRDVAEAAAAHASEGCF